MKNKKMIFIGIIIGILITSTCFVIADTYINSDHVTFKSNNNNWTATTVDSALNDLYTYTSTYKNLTQETTFNAGDLAYGKTAYNKDGSLITGTYKKECAFGTKIVTSDCATSSGCIVYDGFAPTKWTIVYPSTSCYQYYDSSVNLTKFFTGRPGYTGDMRDLTPHFYMENNKFRIANFDSVGDSFNWIVCK